MHEMAIAEALLKQVLDVAGEHDADRVEELTVELGMMRQVVPEALELAFAVVSEGTLAQGAALKQIEKGITAQCRICQLKFPCDVGALQCPKCRQADVMVVAGGDIVLKSVVCQKE